MNIAICVVKSLNLRHLRFLWQIFPSSENISGYVQIVTFSNVSLSQPLTRLRLNIASSWIIKLLFGGRDNYGTMKGSFAVIWGFTKETGKICPSTR